MRREDPSAASDAGTTPRVGTGLRLVVYGGTLIGLALFTTLLAYWGVDEILGALAAAGSGLILVALSHLAPLHAHAVAWRAILRADRRPGLITFVKGRWLGESFNDLLPVAQVGGNLVRTQALIQGGVRGITAGASVVVDMTTHLFAQLLFTLTGLVLLLQLVDSTHLVGHVAAGLVVVTALVLGFYLAQRRGLFSVLHRIIEPLTRAAEWQSIGAGAAALDAEVVQLYGRWRALATATAWNFVGWLLGSLELWIALRLLGHPLDLTKTLMWESLGQAVRTAAFVIPGGLGVQEGSYVLLGGLLGVTPDTALAASLARRVRELLLGVPGLAVWQIGSARSLLRSRVHKK